MATITSVAALKPFKSTWRIQVKVLSQWRSFLNGVETLEVVVVDNTNHKIHLTIPKKLIKKYQSYFVKDKAINITNFKMSPTGGHFRTCTHVYKITVVDTTWINPFNEFPADVHGLSFMTFADINGEGKNTDFLVDVIGQVVYINSIQVLNVGNKQTKKLTMELRDTNDERVQCVLWGDYAEGLETYVQDKNDVVIVFVLQFGKLNFYKERWNVGNAYNSSRMYIDSDFPEVNDFKNRLPSDGVTFRKDHPQQLTVVNTNSVKDDFFIHSPRKTIAEILVATEVQTCVTMGTIMSIDTEYGWYYLACKNCSKKVMHVVMEQFNEGRSKPITTQLYKCTGKCTEYMTDRIPRFMVTFGVMDNTGETKFLLFDKLAEQIIDATALELNPTLKEIEDPDLIPLPLTAVVGKTILFKVSIEREHILGQKETYKVFSIITETEVVKEFSGIETSQDPLLITDGTIADSTPSSKRKSVSTSDEVTPGDIVSVSKKPCVSKMINVDDEADDEANDEAPLIENIKKEKP